MSKLLSQKSAGRPGRALRKGIALTGLSYGQGAPARLHTTASKELVGTCIRCPSTPCISYHPEELIVAPLSSFPADLDNNVCPTGAITCDPSTAIVGISAEMCIGCGICVGRCPTGAIFLNNAAIAIAKVNDSASDGFIDLPTAHTTTSIRPTLDAFRPLKRSGSIATESPQIIAHLFERLSGATQQQSSQFANLLARNLLIALGLSAAMRRRGDVNLRMDLVFSGPSCRIGTAEVELSGQALLDSPRNVLDNVAVLASRYSQPLKEIATLIVSTALPNVRAEYWRVIKDVKKVLGVTIESITIPALIILVWRRATWPPAGSFYADEDKPSIRETMSNVIKRDVDLPDGNYAALEAAK